MHDAEFRYLPTPARIKAQQVSNSLLSTGRASALKKKNAVCALGIFCAAPSEVPPASAALLVLAAEGLGAGALGLTASGLDAALGAGSLLPAPAGKKSM